MTHITKLALALSIMSFAACGSDQPDTPVPAASTKVRVPAAFKPSEDATAAATRCHCGDGTILAFQPCTNIQCINVCNRTHHGTGICQ